MQFKLYKLSVSIWYIIDEKICAWRDFLLVRVERVSGFCSKEYYSFSQKSFALRSLALEH